ncbi:MAG: DUF3750 domain-containing protein [Mesorhizobium sp.]
MKFLRFAVLFLAVVFVLPALSAIGWWFLQDRPSGWRSADWSSSGLLPAASADQDAAVYVLAARTGGLKGALAVHSWIVVKKHGATSYDRYDKVGWGAPVRKNSRSADGRWYSNEPFTVSAIHGADAERIIPRVEAAIESYPFSHNGDYRVWPGSNSNSFIAHVMRIAPELGDLPPNATGRDFWPGGISAGWSRATGDIHATLYGLAGFTAGLTSGIELHFMGLVAGIDVKRGAIKIPAWGRIDLFG